MVKPRVPPATATASATGSATASATADGSGAAFPSGTYGKYKRATEFFLNWLLRARATGVVSADADANARDHDAASTPRQSLDVYERIVDAIATQPTALTPSLLKLWPRALAACQTAITLRARVALFFPPKPASDPHSHFLNRLRKWLKTLRGTSAEPTPATATPPPPAKSKPSEATSSIPDFTNYYDVLALPDDYFADQEDTEETVLPTPTTVRPLSAADRKRLFDAAFAEDLRAELACLFMELDELLEGVYAAFLDVKRETKTLVEATAVAKVAIDSAARVVARLQVLYPSVRDGEDLSTLIKDHLSLEELSGLVTRVQKAWEPTASTTIKSQYAPGTVLVDVLWITRALEKTAPALVENPGARFGAQYHGHSERYSEDDTPHYVVPDLRDTAHFFAQQIPVLVNLLATRRERGVPVHASTLDGWFLAPIEAFCLSGKVTIPLVFTFACWIRSVAALQGRGGLGRTTSLSLLRRWDLQDRITETMAHGTVERASADLQDQLDFWQVMFEFNDHEISAVRLNPILAGCVLLECQLTYLSLGHDALHISPRFRAFCHLYAALRDRDVLGAIHCLDATVRFYQEFEFAPASTPPHDGGYARAYAASSAAATPPPPRRSTTSRKARQPQRHEAAAQLINLSRVLRVVKHGDYRVLPNATSADAAQSSWRQLLDAVAAVTAHELFHSRLLARDLLRLGDAIADLFPALRRALGREGEAAVQRALARRGGRDADGVVVDAVTTALLEKLDGLTHDRNRDGAVALLCLEAAQVITKHFGGSADGARFFTFPSTPAWTTLEFGGPAWNGRDHPDGATLKAFQTLMCMLQTADAPLRGAQLAEFKRLVLAQPAVVGVTHNLQGLRLSTLLHHAAAGAANDHRLVEWLLQHGALTHQPSHCHSAADARALGADDGVFLCNELAVHCAAEKGNVGLVRLLVEASNLRDLDVVTFHAKESLAHIAVRTGNRPIFAVLAALGADVTKPTGAGKYIWELTRNAAWREQLQRMAQWQQQQQALLAAHTSRGAQFKAAADAQAQALRSALRRQRDDAHAQEAQATSATTKTSRAAKKKIPSSTNASTKQSSTNSSSSSAAKPSAADASVAQAVAKLSVSLQTPPASPPTTEDQMARLTAALDALKEQAETPAAVREAHARVAVEILKRLASAVESLHAVGTLLDRAAQEKAALDASVALFRLDAFHAQLPARENSISTPTTALDELRRLAGPDPPAAFEGFFWFALDTACALVQGGKRPRATAVLALLERRLRALATRDATFRELAATYADVRRACGLAPAEGLL